MHQHIKAPMAAYLVCVIYPHPWSAVLSIVSTIADYDTQRIKEKRDVKYEIYRI